MQGSEERVESLSNVLPLSPVWPERISRAAERAGAAAAH